MLIGKCPDCEECGVADGRMCDYCDGKPAIRDAVGDGFVPLVWEGGVDGNAVFQVRGYVPAV
jgi:hypothetical protein